MKQRHQLILSHLLSLSLGGLIYILFRSKNLILFNWIDSFNLPLENIRSSTIKFGLLLPDWFVFSLPDGLWLYSYLTLTLFIWGNRINTENIIWILLTPFIVIITEFGQLLNLFPGTFDFIDIVFYILGGILPIFLYTDLLKFKTIKK